MYLFSKRYMCFCVPVCVYIYATWVSAGDLRGQKRALAPPGPGFAGICEPPTQVQVLSNINPEPPLQSQIYSILYLPFLSPICPFYLKSEFHTCHDRGLQLGLTASITESEWVRPWITAPARSPGSLMMGLSKLPANHTEPFYDLKMLPVKNHLRIIYKDALTNAQQHADFTTHLET